MIWAAETKCNQIVTENPKSQRLLGYCPERRNANVLAGAIYGPSYLSFDFVLAWYGLLPETVQTFTSATLNKRKHKRVGNYFGVYTYRDVPAIAYPLGVQLHREENYYFQMATPEKALLPS